MLKLGSKKRESNDDKNTKEEDNLKESVKESTEGKSESEGGSGTPSKSSEEESKEEQGNGDGKIKVRISRLGNEETKLLEEDEKLEELSGTNSGNNRLKKAGKKIEDMIKKKLKKAGVGVGGKCRFICVL